MLATRTLVLFLLATPAIAQNSGAIYTSNRSGDLVNGNQYRRDRDVYLVGGPGPNAPCTSGGLTDGNYYFQVTDPSGAVLLSTDPITDREVVVLGGVVVDHVTGTHATRNGPCGSKVVQLIPFLPTTNGGDEYKLWMTPVAAFDLAGSGFHGFLASASKTDNFKVRGGGGQMPSQSVITGYKFYDHSEDGLWNPGLNPLEVPIPGWRIEIYRAGALDGVTFTDETGRYCFIREQDDTTYTITEQAPGGFIGDGIPGATWLAMTETSGNVITSGATVQGPDFGNLRFEVAPGVGRTKGFWHNANGRALLLACDPIWRDVLTVRNGVPVCLRRNISSGDPLVSIFAPLQPPVSFADAHDDLAGWLVGDPAWGHAGFILSTQVAASILNNACGHMPGTIYVDRFNNGILVSFEVMIAGATALLCDPMGGLTGPHDPAQALREAMLACSNEFKNINETGDLGEPQVVYSPAPAPGTVSSPY